MFGTLNNCPHEGVGKMKHEYFTPSRSAVHLLVPSGLRGGGEAPFTWRFRVLITPMIQVCGNRLGFIGLRENPESEARGPQP